MEQKLENYDEIIKAERDKIKKLQADKEAQRKQEIMDRRAAKKEAKNSVTEKDKLVAETLKECYAYRKLSRSLRKDVQFQHVK
jgi:hypothetical protein